MTVSRAVTVPMMDARDTGAILLTMCTAAVVLWWWINKCSGDAYMERNELIRFLETSPERV